MNFIMHKKSFTWIVFLFMVLFFSCKKENNSVNTITDIDSNVYTTVSIGNQIWMTEDLKTTKFRNGEPIPLMENSTTWGTLTTSAYCRYGNESTSYVLYNWYAVNDSRNIAPEGWRISTHEDWLELVNYLGGINEAGAFLKSVNTGNWCSSDFQGDNKSGFTAYGNGFRGINGNFSDQMMTGYWWTTDEYDSDRAYLRYMTCVSYKVPLAYGDKRQGFSVRCIKEK